jgi:hypothetical protein
MSSLAQLLHLKGKATLTVSADPGVQDRTVSIILCTKCFEQIFKDQEHACNAELLQKG